MAAPNLYKLDDGASFPTNCFPARTLFRQQEEGAGHWLVAHRASEDQKYRAGKTGNQSNTKVRPQDQLQGFQSSLPLATTKSALKENILDGFFLMKLHYVEDASDLCSVDISDKNLELAKEEDFEMFDNVAYINAAGNLLTFEPFRKFPILRELELSVNGLRNLKVNVGDFPHLEVLDLSYNNLTSDDVLSLGLCPCLRVLYLTGNGLHSLPPDVTASELLKYLNLDKNGITEVPYLQKMDQYNYVCSPVSEKQGGFERLQPRQKLKHGKGLITDLKRMDKPLTIADGDITEEEALVAVALFPSLNELVIRGNPLTTQKSGMITEEEALVAVALFPSLNELVIRGNPLTTQKSGMVNDHPKSDKEEVLESKNQNLKHVSVPDKYKGFEELLDARPDPEFIEPVATILRDKKSQKKEYDEALGLLKELQKKYVKLHTAAVESAAQIENQNQEALHEINKRKTEINQNSSGYFQH
ncbi:X-ray radiation resistance-associated protein 1 [Acipenser ruthenus]|uniref:X-ray radiation resistance-associated protein 1 n=1 Tax=Acipenser ruthenus TaxID=7906 RepID=A0A444V0W4_ACIRT|nr:X-ray radiation resistance-associated protein 1 [Acipenser ruthenus]